MHDSRAEILERALRHPAVRFGATVTLLLIAMALVSLVWTPHDITKLSIPDRFQPASSTHLFGTDQFGRDVFSMIMEGARTSILVALVAVGIGAGLGVPLGLAAAVRGGWPDELLMRASDFAFAFPAVLSAVLITAIWGPGAVNAIIAIGIFNVPVFARLSRGAAMPVWRLDYVAAARLAGRSAPGIALSHVLPNIAPVLIVQGTIQFALAILAEAGLSYLGLGAQPPAASWGRMLNDAQTMIYLAPQLALYPGLAIMISVLGLNMLGDGLRDVLDPRIRRQR